MEKKIFKKILWTAILVGMVLSIGAGATVSASSLGSQITFMGYNGGWFLLGIALLAILVFLAVGKKLTYLKTPMLAVFVGALIFGGILLADYNPPVATVSDTGNLVDEWAITTTNSGTSCGWSDIDAQWDDTDSPTIISAPINLDATTNDLDETKFRANFTITPSGKSGSATDINCKIYYKTEYQMTKGGEDVLEKDGNNWIANWTNSDGTSSDYDGFLQMTLADGSGWAYCNYQLDSGNDTFGEEMDGAIGEQINWKITFWDDYGWKQEFTVSVTKITDD